MTIRRQDGSLPFVDERQHVEGVGHKDPSSTTSVTPKTINSCPESKSLIEISPSRVGWNWGLKSCETDWARWQRAERLGHRETWLQCPLYLVLLES